MDPTPLPVSMYQQRSSITIESTYFTFTAPRSSGRLWAWFRSVTKRHVKIGGRSSAYWYREASGSQIDWISHILSVAKPCWVFQS